MSYLDNVPNDVLRRIREYLVPKDQVYIVKGYRSDNGYTIIYKEHFVEADLHYQHKTEQEHISAIKVIVEYPRKGAVWNGMTINQKSFSISFGLSHGNPYGLFIPSETPGYLVLERIILTALLKNLAEPCQKTTCYCHQLPKKYPTEYNILREQLEKYK